MDIAIGVFLVLYLLLLALYAQAVRNWRRACRNFNHLAATNEKLIATNNGLIKVAEEWKALSMTNARQRDEAISLAQRAMVRDGTLGEPLTTGTSSA